MAANEYEITRHEFDGEKLVFFHKVRQFRKNPTTNLLEYVGDEEKEWFRIKFHDFADVQLVSNEVIYCGVPCSCLGKHLMLYFHKVKPCRLIESREIPNYEESPYGTSIQMGFYIYERWNLTKLVK